MRGRRQSMQPGAKSNAGVFSCSSTSGRRRLLSVLSLGTGKRCLITPGRLPRIAVTKAIISNSAGAPADPAAEPARSTQEAAMAETHLSNSAGPVRPRPLYKVSEDPLLRQTQMLLEASRRLREQSLSVPVVDRETYYGSSSLMHPVEQRHGTWSSNSDGQPRESISSSSMRKPVSSVDAVAAAEGAPLFASFGTLAAASATAAANITAARITALNAAAAAATAAVGNAAAVGVAATATASAAVPGPEAPSAETAGGVAAAACSATGRVALTALAATAYGAAAPLAAHAGAGSIAAGTASSAAAAAASAATSGWLAIEELLEEAAYSLSQELPDVRGSTPLDALLARTSDNAGSAAVPGLDAALELLPQGLVPPALAESVPAAMSSLGLGSAIPQGLGATVPGGDRLSEMLEDLLYSLSQDINLAATQEAVMSAATAAAAGLAGAAAELPRAAVSVYRSATEAAVAAAAARAAAARGAMGGGSGGTAFFVPDENAESLPPYDSILDELAAAADGNPPWDPFGTIRAAEQGSVAVAVAESGAAADTAVAALSPVVTAAEAATVADAAAATAAAVVEAATTSAAGTVVILPPSNAVAELVTPIMPDLTSVPQPTEPSAIQVAPEAAAPSAAAAAAGPAPAPSLANPAAAIDGSPTGGDDQLFDMATEGSQQQLDELAAALQSLLAAPEAALGLSDVGLEAADGAAISSSAAAAAAAATSAAAATAPLPAEDSAAAEAALTGLTEALRRELGTVVDRAADTDPAALAQAAGQAVSSALASLSLDQVDLSSLPQDVRLSTLLGVTLQSSLDLVESALGGIRSADSTLVGGVTIAAVMAVLIRALLSLATTSSGRNGSVDVGGTAEAEAAAAGPTRVRPVGVTALEAAAALNNDPQALLLDIRNGTDVLEQGLPDLRPFRRGAGATAVPLPYCDFRTTPTLANPSGSLLAAAAAGWSGKGVSSGAAAAGSLVPSAGAVTVAVDPLFCTKFKQLTGLSRDSRVFLIDSYGVEAPEAVALLRSDPYVERLLGSQGIKFVEGGFAGPEGWKLTGLPVADASPTGPDGAGNQAAGLRALGLDMSGLLGGVAGLRLRYPSLFSRTLAVGAVGGAGVAVASNLDWGAVSRGAVGLAAAMLVTDRALPQGMRPSSRIRQYLQSQLSEPQQREAAGAAAADIASRRRRVALLLRALDLAEVVGDGIVRASSAAFTAAGNAARGAMAASGPRAAASVDVDAEADLETSPPAVTPSTAAATIVLPHGMDSPQWSQAAEHAVAQAQQQQQAPQEQQLQQVAATIAAPLPPAPQQPQQQLGRSASPLRPNWRLGPSATPAEAGAASSAAPGTSSPSLSTVSAEALSSSSSSLQPSSPRLPGSSMAGHLTGVLRNAADAVIRAASPSRAGRAAPAGVAADAGRAASPRGSSGKPDTLELMAALAVASGLSNLDSGVVPGWPATSFPRASAGQTPPQTTTTTEEGTDGQRELKDRQPPVAAEEIRRGGVFGGDDAKERGAGSLTEPVTMPAGVAEEEQKSGSLWGSWRQELEAVAPPPPKLPQEDGGRRRGSAGGSGDGGSSGNGVRQIRKTLRTASPERAAAAGAAMQRLRAQLEGLDDDGLASGAFSSVGGSAAGGDEASEVPKARADDADPSRRSGGPAQPGQMDRRWQHLDGTSTAAQEGPAAARPKKPLRTASPERAAAAAVAMRKLRAEMGLPPNDGLDVTAAAAASAARAVEAAVTPRDWRRELEAASADLGLEAESPTKSGHQAGPPRGSSGGSDDGLRRRSATVAAAVTTSPSRSPRNWRDQLEGRRQSAGGDSGSGITSAAPADWRTRIEGSGGRAEAVQHNVGEGDGRVLVRSGGGASPRGAKLTAAERAARDAKLQDWRARV